MDRSSGRLTAALGGIVVVVCVIFAFESAWYTNWYALFRVAHVVVAVFWVGGGVLLAVLGLRAERSKDPNELATLVRQAAFTGEKLFAPAGGIVLVMGIAMMLNINWGWGRFWVVVGLLGYAITFTTGIAVLSPLAKKLDKLMAEKGPTAPETQAAIQRLLPLIRAPASM